MLSKYDNEGQNTKRLKEHKQYKITGGHAKPLSSHPQNIADPDLWRAGEDALEPRTQGAYVTYTNFIVCRYIYAAPVPQW